MALFRGVRSTTSLFTRLRTSSVENFYRIQSSLFASSSDEEPQRPQLPVKPTADTDDPKARAEYRTWVENMLTALQTEAEGKSNTPQANQLATDAQPAEDPTTGKVEGNHGLADVAAVPEPSKEVTREPSSVLAADTVGTVSEIAAGTQPVTAAGTQPSPAASGTIPSNAASISAQRSKPTRVTVRETVEAVPDAVLGYTELGLGPDDGALLDQGEGRINSARKFWPNESYDPQDLAIPYGSIDLRGQFAARTRARPRTAVKKATSAEALQQADFRNLSFLHRFTSEAGLLPPRRVTKLQKKVHVHVMRQIKIARQMALLPHEGKLEELQVLLQQQGRRPSGRVPAPEQRTVREAVGSSLDGQPGLSPRQLNLGTPIEMQRQQRRDAARPALSPNHS